MDKAEQILDKHINEDDLNFIFHEKKQLWQELLNAVNEALRQPPVIKSVCGDCLYYLTCNHESRDKQICNNYDNEP